MFETNYEVIINKDGFFEIRRKSDKSLVCSCPDIVQVQFVFKALEIQDTMMRLKQLGV